MPTLDRPNPTRRRRVWTVVQIVLAVAFIVAFLWSFWVLKVGFVHVPQGQIPGP